MYMISSVFICRLLIYDGKLAGSASVACRTPISNVRVKLSVLVQQASPIGVVCEQHQKVFLCISISCVHVMFFFLMAF